MELVWNANCSSSSTAELPLEWCEGLKGERHRSRPLFRIGDSESGSMEILSTCSLACGGEKKELGRITIGMVISCRGHEYSNVGLNGSIVINCT